MQAPEIREYLPAAISKAVYRTGMSHPATVYPIAIGAGTGFVGWLFNMQVLYAVAVCGIIAGPLWAVIQIFFLHEKIGGRYISKLNKRQKRYEHHVKKMLKKELAECGSISGAESFAQQGVNHYQKIEEKLINIQAVLDLKVETTELTYGRFLGAAEQVSLGVLDNLKDVVTTLKSAGSIDTEYINERLRFLQKKHENTHEDQKQKETLLQRLELRNKQFDMVNQLLTKNEEAMTEMEKISAAVAEWQTDDNFSEIDFESAIARLQELAGLAQDYNKP